MGSRSLIRFVIKLLIQLICLKIRIACVLINGLSMVKGLFRSAVYVDVTESLSVFLLYVCIATVFEMNGLRIEPIKKESRFTYIKFNNLWNIWKNSIESFNYA